MMVAAEMAFGMAIEQPAQQLSLETPRVTGLVQE
jgi:hypothetical protein